MAAVAAAVAEPLEVGATRARAAAALAVFAVVGDRIGGIVLRDTSAGAQEFIAALRGLLPPAMRVLRLPASATDDRIFGGLDLAATIGTGRPVAERGVLAEAHGGVVVIPLIERMPVATQARLGAVIDTGIAQVLRDGVSAQFDARFALIAIDESDEEVWGVAAPLRDRLALVLDGDVRLDPSLLPTAAVVQAARETVSAVHADDEVLRGLGAICIAFGIASERAARHALWTARAIAALDARQEVDEDDVALAVQLVLAPRATRVPPPEDEEAAPPPDADDTAPPPPPPPAPATNEAEPPPADDVPPPDEPAPEPPGEGQLEDRLIDAVSAALPPELLAALLARAQRPSQEMGRAGAEKESWTRGRQVAARRGKPDGVRRLHVLETLRTAAPWQRARARVRADRGEAVRSLIVERDDFRIRRYVERAGTSVIFVVDASGSAAAQRLGEAKGAVEALLAESYARRDRVSLIAFRGTTADVLLPPTRALARARKLLASLPGGGGTPLATAIDTSITAGISARRAGTLPVIVFLTDGRANVARDGKGGRAESMRDVLDAAAQFRSNDLSAVLIDTSPRPEPMAKRVAEALGARYVPLPVVDARAIAGAVALARETA
ncbi:MAG: magnesium chelatase subunit D [Gemmatimonadaceae bacterium]|nr:magnesium chelatase subunit D [Gemmatimonadaceae bacterium]